MPEQDRGPLIPRPYSYAIDAGLSYLAYRLLRYAVNRRLSMRSFATLEVIDAPGGASVGGRSVLPGPVSRVPPALAQLAQAVEAQIAANVARAPTVVQTPPSAPTLLPPRPGNPVQAYGPRAVGLTPGNAPTVLAGGPTQVVVPPTLPEGVVLPTVTQLPRGARTQLAGPARPTTLRPTPPAPPPVDLGEGMGFPGGGGGRPGGRGSLPLPRILPLPLAGQIGVQAGRALAEAQQGPVPGGPATLGELGSVLTTGPGGPSWFAPAAPEPLPPGTSLWPGAVFPPGPRPGGLGVFGFALPGAAGGADWTAAPPRPAFAFPPDLRPLTPPLFYGGDTLPAVPSPPARPAAGGVRPRAGSVVR